MASKASYFDGKVAIVTGSGTGIGRAIAEALFAAGATVVLNSRSEASEAVAAALDSSGARAVAFRADVATDAGCRALAKHAVDTFGRIDFLVNNAGKNHPVVHTDLEGVTEEALRGVFELNTFGTFYMCRAAMPHLKETGDGSIVNVTSIAGIRPGGSSMPYSMSKAATNHLTLMLAKSFGPAVRVNAIAPGLTDTPMMQDPQHDKKKVGSTCVRVYCGWKGNRNGWMD
jgi:ketoreductase RED2